MEVAEAEPRAHPGFDRGQSGRHARLNETQQSAPEGLNPLGARLGRDGQGEQKGSFPTLHQGRPWRRRGPLPTQSSVRCRRSVVGKAQRKWRVGRGPCPQLKRTEVQQGLQTQKQRENRWRMFWQEEPSWDLAKWRKGEHGQRVI